MDEFLTTRQLAAYLQVSPETVRAWVRTGRIPEIRVSAKVRRFKIVDVERALRHRTKGGKPC